MSSYAILRVGDFQIHQSQTYVDDISVCLFTELDKDFPLSPEEGEPVEFVYRASVREVIDRLKIHGVTYRKAVMAFKEGVNEIYESRWEEHVAARHFLSEEYEGALGDWQRYHYESIKDEREYDFCQTYTFDSWLGGIFGHSTEGTDVEFRVEPNLPLPIAEEFHNYFLGFPHQNSLFALRAIIEQFDIDEEVVLDCTDLVESGYMSLHSEVCDVTPHITILTEGPTDIDLLRPTLGVLYPHLEDYFSFMDFRTLSIEANAAALVKLIKAFAASGIKQKFLAIFDNDAAATTALRALKNQDIPDNIKFMQLPSLLSATDYPTIGPQGESNADVNGCACSIEMYLGDDVLRNEKGELYKVRWGAFLEGAKVYQGELQHKKEIQQKYLSKIMIDYPDQWPDHDWSGMELVLEAMFEACS